jgi:exodeoxyribonuclease-3
VGSRLDKTLKLATWNVNSLKVRLPHLLTWLLANTPDVVCLQETKTEDATFPAADIQAAGYQLIYSGQKTYNGVAILSRATASEVAVGIAGFADEQKRVLAATVDGVRVVCIYVPNGESVESDKYRYKLNWSSTLGWCYWATTTSRQRRAMYTIQVCGKGRCSSASRNVPRSAAYCRWV